MIQTYFKKLGLASLLLSGCILGASEAQAQIATYSFTGSAGSEDSLAVDAQPVNATFFNMKRGAGVIASGGANTIAATDWSLTTLDATDFFTFKVKPAAGFQISIDSIKLDERRSGTGIRDWAVRSSRDNFTTNLATFNVPDDTNTRTGNKVSLGTDFDNLTTGTEFRIYGYTAEAAGGSWRIDNVMVYGTITSTGATPTTTIAFAAATASVAENVTGGTQTVTVNIANPSATVASSVNVGLSTTGTATAGTDFTFTGSTLNWAAGDNTPKTVTITIIDDAIIEANETVILTLSNPSTGVTVGAGTFTLTITDNEVAPIPTYTVTQIDNTDPVNFLPDSAGVKVRVYGTLYGVNQRTTGLQLTLIDNTGGIGLFTSSAAVVPTTAPVEGDSVYVVGTVGHFNGLAQITLDSIVVLANNRTLIQPAAVTVLDETTESELVTIANPVTLVDPTQWTNTGSGFNVDITDGTNTYQMRIVATSDIFGTPAPTGTFVVTGIGGQFDSSDPRNEGYQLIPRRLSDIRNVTGISENLSNAISIYPNPVANVLNLNLSAVNTKNAAISVINTLGQVVATVPANATEMNVSKFPAGVYTLRIATQQGVAVKRFVKIN